MIFYSELLSDLFIVLFIWSVCYYCDMDINYKYRFAGVDT